MQFLRAIWPAIRAPKLVPIAGLLAALLIVSAVPSLAQEPNPNVRPPAGASVPSGPAGSEGVRTWNYDLEMWQQLRQGAEGKVTIPDTKAGRLVDSSGEAWRNLRNGPLPVYGAWLLAGTVGLIALFFLVRGRIKVEHGWAGRTIERFSG